MLHRCISILSIHFLVLVLFFFFSAGKELYKPVNKGFRDIQALQTPSMTISLEYKSKMKHKPIMSS